MTRFIAPALALLAAGGAGACSPVGPAVRLSGAETRPGLADTMVVPAAVYRTPEGWRMEMVAGDGTVLGGTLQEQREPAIAPVAAPGAAPLVGGATVLVGGVAGGALALECRLRLLNPVRGPDGGGAGQCIGRDRQVEFIF